jgi:hypothetical protein
VLVELGECCWVEGDIVDCMLRIEDEYLASAEKNDVAAFACWLEGLRLVPPFFLVDLYCIWIHEQLVYTAQLLL